MYRPTFILFIIISFLICTLEVALPADSLLVKDPITPAKPLSTLKIQANIALPPATIKKGYDYQIQVGGKRPVLCKLISGTLPRGLTLNKTGRISGTPFKAGNFQFGINITDNKKTSLRYQFSLSVNQSGILSGTKPESKSKMNTLSTKSPVSKFNVLNVSLFFGDGTSKTTVNSKMKNHRAYAMVSFEGSGWLKGQWQLNGKTLSRIKEYIDPAVIEKKKLSAPWDSHPGLRKRIPDIAPTQSDSSKKFSTDPSKMPATRRSGNIHIISSPALPVHAVSGKKPYSLNLIVIDSSQKRLSAQATYYVSAVKKNQRSEILLLTPRDESDVDYAPTTFSWKQSKSAEIYIINFLDKKGEKVLFSADTKGLEYRLVPSEYKKLFSPEKEYVWRVIASNKEKNLMAKSRDYRFTFLPSSTHVTGQILLVLKDPGNAKKRIKQLTKKYDLHLIKSHAIRSLRQTMAVFSTKEDIYTVIKAVKKEKYIVSAQPNNIFRTMAEPMAEMQNIYNMCHLSKLHERYTGKRVTVGIVDTGVDTYHKDLKGRITAHENYVDNSLYKGEIHGTAVAGIIGAGINNFGIAGVAPEVKIIALRACKQVSEVHPEGRCQTYAITQALDTAIEMDADIVNMSFGSSVGDTLLRSLIDEGARRGMIFVAPVGNREAQKSLWFPASHRNVIAVAGTDESGNPYPNAEIASKADVCAPASNLFTTVPGQKHNFLNGTSMSSAVISGLLAVAHGKNSRIIASQLPVFNGDLCQWEQELVKISLCEE